MRYLAVLGDKTSHGGAVIEASSSMDINGKVIPLVGDKVSCPQHGPNAIVEGIEGWDEGGRLVVGHHCRSACGSLVIAHQTEMEA